ncbi:hypothetical protein DBR43_08870 [Pedobacter sp. KBW06]|uniref:hypothetical protein n=1 Tax=Pedobacter sp. KBW06 TaxID=2153359 RepID=UPI000F5AF9F5|nr:hypothetical protein [Pedobacter sp. KBW06]RQO75449.1 hypothetical protein DBR43_08870 [Pedobacter sp. KBW06]
MAPSLTHNPKIKELYLYIANHRGWDSEYWYGGISAVTGFLFRFDDNDLEQLVAGFRDWERDFLENFAEALTADGDHVGSLANRAYLYGHLFLVFDPPCYNMLDNNDFLAHSDHKIKPILHKIRYRLQELNFVGYCPNSLRNFKELVEKLIQTL